MTGSKKKKKKDPELRLIHRIVDGIAGWITFQQAANAKALYCEHFFYSPIYDIAAGLKWRVLTQAQIKKSIPKRGTHQTIDFVFYTKLKNGSI